MLVPTIFESIVGIHELPDQKNGREERMIKMRKAWGRFALSKTIVSISAVTACLTCAGTAQAQGVVGPDEDAAAQSRSSRRFDDIVVTARRRAESVQDTPLAVSAISAADVEELNITRLEGLEQMAPSLRVSTASGSGNAPAIFIRGIGTITTALYAEPAVGVYIDGVYSPRGAVNTFDLPDVEGIQVLRGPQGTLFGRNTTGGAVILTTKGPSDDPGASMRFSYGTDNEIVASTIVQTGNIAGTDFGLKLSGQVHTRDGWVETPGYSPSKWGGALEAYTFGAAFGGDISSVLNFDGRVRYNKVSSYNGWEPLGGSTNGVAYFTGGVNRGGPPFIIGGGADDFTYRDPRAGDGQATAKSWIASGTLTANLSDALTLKSITGGIWLDQQFRANLGGGYTIGPVINPIVPGQLEIVSPHTTTANPGRARQFTQEFQALGDIGTFNYVVGLYYFRENTDEGLTTIINFPVSPAAAIRLDTDKGYEILSKSYAAYGQVGWKPQFADGNLEITGGLRYTEDKKTLDSYVTGGATQAEKNSWDNLGWSASVSYKVTPDTMIYGRASSAYRSGGYNGPTVGAPPFGPETATTYEAGFKADLFDRMVRLNGAVFQTDYKDLQVNAYNSLIFANAITNAGKARYRGFELEAALRAGGFTLDGNVGYVDPEYLEYEYLISGNVEDVSDIAKFPYVSSWTYRIGGQYEFLTGNEGSLTVRADYSGKSSPYGYSVPLSTPNYLVIEKLGADENLSARATWRENVRGADMFLQVFGENLTDKRARTFASDFSSIVSGVYNRGRRYGFTVGLGF
jgi:iron complex outermembrane recepter protein